MISEWDIAIYRLINGERQKDAELTIQTSDLGETIKMLNDQENLIGFNNSTFQIKEHKKCTD